MTGSWSDERRYGDPAPGGRPALVVVRRPRARRDDLPPPGMAGPDPRAVRLSDRGLLRPGRTRGGRGRRAAGARPQPAHRPAPRGLPVLRRVSAPGRRARPRRARRRPGRPEPADGRLAGGALRLRSGAGRAAGRAVLPPRPGPGPRG